MVALNGNWTGHKNRFPSSQLISYVSQFLQSFQNIDSQSAAEIYQ